MTTAASCICYVLCIFSIFVLKHLHTLTGLKMSFEQQADDRRHFQFVESNGEKGAEFISMNEWQVSGWGKGGSQARGIKS